jgi:mRNA-degrading endonuclease RelE of RelBE toxin-antitoxin system
LAILDTVARLGLPSGFSTAKRLRVGDYRVLFEESAAEILVTKIGPRSSVYD